MKWYSGVALALALGAAGCATKWLPDAEAAINPPVAYQQQFIAEALDDCFSTMDFSRLRGQVVEIEVLGVYVDGDVADYYRSKLQVELAKAGAISETYLVDKPPTYKANIMLRMGGVNDLVKSALLYEWRQKQYTYDVQVAVFSVTGKDYFIQSGQGENAATIARAFYFLFFPIPLPCEWSPRKGRSFFAQVNETYDAGKRAFDSSRARRDRSNILTTLQP